MTLKNLVPPGLRRLRASVLKLRSLARAEAEHRLIEVEYPYFPERRDLGEAPAGKVMLDLLDGRQDAFAGLIGEFGRFRSELERVPVNGSPDGLEPYWVNGWIPGLDAASIYGLLATRNPANYLEVGSGNSTKFARRAIADHGLKTKITSIDPHPRAGIDKLCDDVIRAPLESVPHGRIAPLLADSLIYIDCSHRSFQNSDVTVFFSDLLPVIPKGSAWGLHDIYLPCDYPREWADRFFNEQYLLMAYLLGGCGRDSVLFPCAYISDHDSLSKDVTASLFKSAHFDPIEKSGCCFWMERA